MKNKFNKYCAEVMGYKEDLAGRLIKDEQFIAYSLNYNPYEDLNQMKEPFDKLNDSVFDKQAQEFQMNVFVRGIEIEKAMRDFIISIMLIEPI